MMSSALLAGAVRKSLKALNRIVLCQLQRTTAMSCGMEGTSTVTQSSDNPSTIGLSGVKIENSFIRTTSSWAAAGMGGKRSSLISPCHVRFSNSNSSDSSKEEKEATSEDWGVTTKNYYREDGSKWPWKSFRPSDTYSPNLNIDLHKHREPNRWDEKIALRIVQLIKIPTVLFYKTRYGCRAMMLETVAAVPGMVGGMQLHLRSLRRFEQSGGWIRALLDEAENERMHLMTLMELVQPAWYERGLVVATQGVFFTSYFVLYLMSPRMAHRVTGYLEEEAIKSYTTYLEEIDNGTVENVPAPAIAIDYWRLPEGAKLRDVIVALRADEAHHRDVNHYAADIRTKGKLLRDAPAPIDYH